MGSQRGTIFSTGFFRSHLNRFYVSWARNSARLGSELGPIRLRIVVRLDSGLFWLLDSRTQHEDSTRLDSTSLKARLGLLKSRTSSSLSSARYSGFSLSRLVNRARLGAHSGLGKPAQCLAQLNSELGSARSGLSSGLRWGLAWGCGTRDSFFCVFNCVNLV